MVVSEHVQQTLTPVESAEIANLYAKCNLAGDFGRPTEYANCYVKEGVLVLNGDVIASGEQELIGLIAQHEVERQGRYKRHITSGLHTVKTAPTAIHGQCYLVVYREGPAGAPALTELGYFEDDLVRERGRWYFSRRSLTFDYSASELTTR